MTRKWTAILVVLATSWHSPSAGAAEITHVLDAFDGTKVWDGAFGLRFVHMQRSALLVREWICQSDDYVVDGETNPLCPDGNRVVDTRQLATNESLNLLNIDLRAGLYHDMELYVTLPIVVGWSSSVAYDDGVTGDNSLVDSELRPSLFSVPHDSANRVGFGDLQLGLKIAPFHESRDPVYPSWVLGVEYVAPTGNAREAGSSGVGSGVHELTLRTAISRRVLPWFDPWFELHGTLRLEQANGPFQHEVETQTLVRPGPSLGLVIGTEFHPWGEPGDGSRYLSLDLGFRADFTFEGREFTDLFDPVGTSQCSPEINCHRTVYTRKSDFVDDDGDGVADDLRRSDGITDVEQYGRFGLHAGVVYQAMEYLKVRLRFEYRHTTSHFITFADAGKDLDPEEKNDVQRSNSQGLNEYNPFFNENYDDFGRRFRVDQDDAFQFMLSIEGQI